MHRSLWKANDILQSLGFRRHGGTSQAVMRDERFAVLVWVLHALSPLPMEMLIGIQSLMLIVGQRTCQSI